MTSHIFTGPYAVNEEHLLDDTVLRKALDEMEAAGARFSADFIKDAAIRRQYLIKIKAMSVEVTAEVAQGKLSTKDGAAFAADMRNRIMQESRKATSAQGLAYVESLKKKGKTLKELQDMRTEELFKNKTFNELSVRQKQAVYYRIIERSGSDNAKFTSVTRKLSIMGKVGILMTGTLAVHAIFSAENAVKETARQVTIIEGGLAGGLLAGMGVSALCGPAAPVCAVAAVLLGSAAGGYFGDWLFDAFDEEVMEFSTWSIQ